jgi:hypothetical protein
MTFERKDVEIPLFSLRVALRSFPAEYWLAERKLGAGFPV